MIRNHLKSLLRITLFLTSLSWVGCGCVQSPDAPTPVVTPQIELGATDLDVSVAEPLVERASTLGELVQKTWRYGEDRWMKSDALHNTPQSFVKTAFKAMTSSNDAHSLRLAIELIQLDDASSFQKAESILQRLRSDETPDSAAKVVPDVLDYYLGQIELRRAQSAQNKEDAQNHAVNASRYFASASAIRTSSFYHRAKEGEVWACAASADACNAAAKIDAFLAVYPDYPKTADLLLQKARVQMAQSFIAAASITLDELIWQYPWTEAAKQAAELMSQNGMTPRIRGYEEMLEHVDFLRKKRFWNLAQIDVDKALEKFPNDVQLMLQDARISYEQSIYGPAVEKFQKLYDALNGEKKDGIRPGGVVAYIYRALGYMGRCDEAFEQLDKSMSLLGRKDRLNARYEYAMTCGAFDKAWKWAQELGSALPDYDYAFIAYLAGMYETARYKFDQSLEGLSGSSKRRARYFLGMATLKAAQAKAEELRHAACQEDVACSADPKKELSNSEQDDALKNALVENDKAEAKAAAEAAAKASKSKAKTSKTKTSKSSKTASSSKSSKAKTSTAKQTKAPKKAPRRALPEATVELAQKQFKQLMTEDSSDYYALLAYSRLLELDGQAAIADSPLYMPNAGSPIDIADEKAGQSRDFFSTYTFDEVERYADNDLSGFLATNVAKFKEGWPELKRIQMLHEAGLYAERNDEYRHVLMEGNAITRLAARPSSKNLWNSTISIDGHLVDNRRVQTGYWGIKTDAKYFELPNKKNVAEREKIAKHQQFIFDHRAEIRPFLINTALLFHDYYLARKYIPTPRSLPGTAADNDTWSIMYPHAYDAALVRASAENGISPYLVWTLMNIESAFNPDSVSIADAYGLLQIIPITGYKLAEAVHKDPFGPYELIEPENSIPMGAWYFGQIVKKFHGYATLSMAGYNGGPFQVSRWLTAYGGKIEHDAFIELIPLNEARNYVKKGLSRLLIYKRIDDADPKRFYYVPNSLPDSYEFMPNF